MCKRDSWGKNRAFVETQCAKGTLKKFGHFGGENRAFWKNESTKGTLW